MRPSLSYMFYHKSRVLGNKIGDKSQLKKQVLPSMPDSCGPS